MSQLSNRIMSFNSAEHFVRIHEEGTIVEMENEEVILQNFNKRRCEFDAWPLAPIPGTTTSFSTSWLILVKPPPPHNDMEFPTTGDQFTIDMVDVVERNNSTYSLVHLLGERISNPYEDMENASDGIRRSVAFKVEVPRS